MASSFSTLSPCHCVFFFSLSWPPSLSWLSDMNGHSNKRQRQPALLGHHPTEYGKAPGGHQHVHSQKRGATCLIWVHRSTVALRWCCVESFRIAVMCVWVISAIIHCVLFLPGGYGYQDESYGGYDGRRVGPSMGGPRRGGASQRYGGQYGAPPPPPPGEYSAHAESPVMMVYGLEPSKINADRVFNIFCLYGNVERVRKRLNSLCLNLLK